MCSLKGPFIFIILSLTLNSLEATPVKSYQILLKIVPMDNFQEMIAPSSTLTENHHLEKRKCNTATCVTQRLADFLVRSSNTIGTIYSPTNVGANTYGKRGREVPNYLQL